MSVYLSEYINPDSRRYLEEHVKVVDTFDHPEEVEGIILRNIPVTAELMDKLPNLKVISKHGVGCNTIDLDAAKQRGITVINTPGANAGSVAELIVGLILDISRNITAAKEKTEDGNFKKIAPAEMTGMELTGKTLGLVGAGNIARKVADILQGGFRMSVLAYDPYVSEGRMAQYGYEKIESVKELIERSDVVNVSVPLTPETKDLIAGEMFDIFKKGAVLVNAARGGIVNEDDLYEALKTGKLRAAACDAFVTEPPTRANTRLFELSNFVGTPHIGACAEEALVRMGDESVKECLKVLAGGQPAHRVV
ncbi:hydroxyacid dehydrogenase [Anaerolactibacter massiliensis]|uniref:hydroxyacid dehydrogenase n=1 Tax=Anaerolactibacter massiliensis TaxID=2044573 RepID=UPI000CF8A56A|nr:hydroxyacid dehydrogenase [Anaerolactibacter massiliensis]